MKNGIYFNSSIRVFKKNNLNELKLFSKKNKLLKFKIKKNI